MVSHSSNEPRRPIGHIKLDIYHYTFAGFKKDDSRKARDCPCSCAFGYLLLVPVEGESEDVNRYYNAEKMWGFAIYVIEFHY